ncbi:hypothetical protein ACTD5D_19010 [Nocardia takedensis]|uniref:hypothetical protein n=1 Tax=Nocardia takedensis TaxID=259390 RepID=UPI0002EA288A|nr:hypothetical protein [Nocardia takedensis]
MLIILGLIVLLVAVIVAVAGVLSNAGATHALTGDFSVFGYHVTGSTGTLFLYGIIVGAVAMLGLSLLLAGARRTSRRGRMARRELRRREENIYATDDVRPVAPVAQRSRTWRHPFGGNPSVGQPTVTH